MAHGDITHHDIPCLDLDRATAFYGEVFGWAISEMPGFEGYPMWQGPNGLSGGGFVARAEGIATPRSYVEVESIEESLAQITALGGTVIAEKQPIDETSWWAVFQDTEGNVMGLYQSPGTERKQ